MSKEHYSKRELERQIDSAYYERSKKPLPESVPQDVRKSIKYNSIHVEIR